MRLLPVQPPPGPSRPDFWRSPLRSAWLTTMLGSALLVGVGIVAVTGLLSHAAYQPELGRNALVPLDRDVGILVIGWPTSPSWLYALTQGLHVTVGIVIVPLLLAKLWSVIPRLFAWPPLSSPGQVLDRLALLILVGSALFQFATGIADAQLYYPWHFSFVIAHYYGGLIFVGALVLHVVTRVPVMRRAYATRDRVLSPEEDHLVAPSPDPPSLSRRGLFGLVGAGAGVLAVATAGQSIGGPLRELAVLAPRGTGEGFPVNKTARVAKVTPAMAGDGWRLQLAGGREVQLSRADLLKMAQHSESLPIACVEGWSSTQRWTGVRLTDLAALAGVPEPAELRVGSLQPAGAFRQTTLGPGQVTDPRSLLALKVNGRDLTLDHGFPARIIVPALPGVHCTKWVGSLRFA
jgi:DMSO/TMAO reductase YedYZ molybdopterin-dependent catalytic subunit